MQCTSGKLAHYTWPMAMQREATVVSSIPFLTQDVLKTAGGVCACAKMLLPTVLCHSNLPYLIAFVIY